MPTDVEWLTIEPWRSITFSGWTVHSDAPFPRGFAEAELPDLLIADCSEHACLILDDSNKMLTEQDVLSAVRHYLQEQQP